MKLTNLRIGNIYQAKSPEKKDWVVGHKLCKFGIQQAINKEIDISPLDLTDEWLWALGAEVNNNEYVYDRFLLFWKSSYKYWYVVDEHLTYFTKVEYVHEWQDFIRAVNGEELELRPEVKKDLINHQ